MSNCFSGKRIEFHILQSFPASCLNRDDVGSPKSAVVGGVPRARVSSQCWKRSVRLALHDQGITLGVRSKHIDRLLRDACLKAGADEKQAGDCASKIAYVLRDDTLFFMGPSEAERFAKYAASKNFSLPEAAKKKDVKAYKADKDFKEARKGYRNSSSALDGLDIALFGRMVASFRDMGVEAAASFSHAISTHRATPEIDFFTALDDIKEYDDAGSSHMGTAEFTSATYYRYICLDLGQLAQTIGDEDESQLKEDMRTAVSAFVKALYVAVPSARQKTFAGLCGWDYAKVLVRRGQALQCSFEKPVAKAKDGGGYLEPSIKALQAFLQAKERMSGSLFGKLGEYELSEKTGSLDELVEAVCGFCGL